MSPRHRPQEIVEVTVAVPRRVLDRTVQALSEVAMENNAIVTVGSEAYALEFQPARQQNGAPEVQAGPTKHSVTTSIVDELTGQPVAAVTKDDIRAFAVRKGYTATAGAATFSRIWNNLAVHRAADGPVEVDFGVLGQAVGDDGPEKPERISGLRVDTLPALADFIRQGNVRNFGSQAKAVFFGFIEEFHGLPEE